jgi:hypothetical protein
MLRRSRQTGMQKRIILANSAAAGLSFHHNCEQWIGATRAATKKSAGGNASGGSLLSPERRPT